jgi:hypothetical protein
VRRKGRAGSDGETSLPGPLGQWCVGVESREIAVGSIQKTHQLGLLKIDPWQFNFNVYFFKLLKYFS